MNAAEKIVSYVESLQIDFINWTICCLVVMKFEMCLQRKASEIEMCLQIILSIGLSAVWWL